MTLLKSSKSLKEKILRIFLTVGGWMVLVFLGGLIAYAIGAQYYKVFANQTQTISEFSICKQVANNGTQDIFIPTNTSTEWTTFLANKPNYVSLSECPLLYGSVHTYADCTNAGGAVVDDGAGNKFCKFSAGSCPGGWTQYGSFSETSPRSCSGTQIDPLCPSGCQTGSHSFANIPAETCRYSDYSVFVPATCYYQSCFNYPCGVSCSWRRGCRTNWCNSCISVPYPCGGSCQFGNGIDCYANTTSKGCY